MRRLIRTLFLFAGVSACAPTLTPAVQPTIQPLITSTAATFSCSPDASGSKCQSGQDSVIRWQSCAVPMPASDTHCIIHTVSILSTPSVRYVNWPKAGIERSVVRDYLTVSRCCYLYFSPEEDILEYDISPPERMQTSVFVGSGEAAGQGILTTYVKGFTQYNGTGITLDFLAISSIAPISQGSAYQYAIENSGSPMVASWNFPDDPFIGQALGQPGQGQLPLDLLPDQLTYGSAGVFDTPTQIGSPTFTVFDPLGQPLLSLGSLAFRPFNPQP